VSNNINLQSFVDAIITNNDKRHEHLIAQLEKIYTHLITKQEQGGAFFETKVLSVGGQPYEVNYWGRKHLFVYNPNAASITLTSSDFGGIVCPAATWTNLGFPETTRLTTSANVVLVFKATDEVVP
jgi:hypothetical protein